MINKNPQEIEELGLPERWSVLLSEGLLAIVFGIIILAWPGISLLVMVTLFGIYAIIDGISAIWLGITGKRSFLFMLVIGLIGVGAGLVILAWPGLTLFALLVIMAVWAIGKGLVQVVSAISRRQEENSWLTGVAGTLSLVFGVLLLAWPITGLLVLVMLTGLYLILFGITLAFTSIQLKHMREAKAR
ncbi:MAG: HdeD family acid-resistance protein [Thermodesulfobacteriota bacterium]|nr:MAG: HdeD family acid-resistance protein [Thermodesulfobacteriota bacterium]